MAGHSKWSNIKRKKGAADAKRSKLFSRAVKEIHVAVKEGGSMDPEANAALRNAIANARGVNMPKDTIENAIKKAGGANSDQFEQVTFEGYGPHGIAFFIECTTDNTNRTVANVRAIFSRHDGTLGTNGSLEFLFDRKGVFSIDRKAVSMDLEEFEFSLIESGLESMEVEDDFIQIYTSFTDYGKMAKTLEDMAIEVSNATLERIPLNTVALPLDQARNIIEMEEKFEEDDDVQNVFHNLEMTDEFIEALQAEEA